MRSRPSWSMIKKKCNKAQCLSSGSPPWKHVELKTYLARTPSPIRANQIANCSHNQCPTLFSPTRSNKASRLALKVVTLLLLQEIAAPLFARVACLTFQTSSHDVQTMQTRPLFKMRRPWIWTAKHLFSSNRVLGQSSTIQIGRQGTRWTTNTSCDSSKRLRCHRRGWCLIWLRGRMHNQLYQSWVGHLYSRTLTTRASASEATVLSSSNSNLSPFKNSCHLLGDKELLSNQLLLASLQPQVNRNQWLCIHTSKTKTTTPKSSTLLWSKKTLQSSCRQLFTPKKVSSKSALRPIIHKELPWIAILTSLTKSKRHLESEKEKDLTMRVKIVGEGQSQRSTSISMAMETQWRAVAPILIFKAVGWQLYLRELVKIANFMAASSTQATVPS